VTQSWLHFTIPIF